MRKVQRRTTTKRLTRCAPWLWRETHQSPPRTCLTHHREPVHYRVSEQEGHVIKVGEFDWMLRLYQHHGLTYASVRPEGGIAYFEQEWEFITARGCEWLEFVDMSKVSVSRVDFRIAQRYGSWESTPRGRMLVVPVDHYTISE